MTSKFFSGARKLVMIGSMIVLFAVLFIIVFLILPKSSHPQQGQKQDTLIPTVTQGATQTHQVSPTPTALTALLQQFPLTQGTIWTYSYTDYDPDPNDPSKSVQAVFEITRTVTDVKTVDVTYYAHIQNQVKKISEDPGWAAQAQNPPMDNHFWYIVKGNQVYSGPESDSPEDIPKDQLTLEFVFPLVKDVEWCPNPIGKASVDDPATSIPCNPIGKRVIVGETAHPSPAGNYDHCFQIEDIYNSGGEVQTFCNGVGIVDAKYDHAGSKFGFSQILTAFQASEAEPLGKETLSPTPTPGPSPDANAFPESFCGIRGLSISLMLTNAIRGPTYCRFISIPIKIYSEQAFGGFSLDYPQERQLSMTEDGQESFSFSGPFQIQAFHTITDLPLSKIEQPRRVYDFVSLPMISA